MKPQPYNFILLLLILFYAGCKPPYDSRMEKPDGYGGGYNLTPLGRFVYGPWEPDPLNTGYNVSIYHNDSLINSYAAYYDEDERNLVFKLKGNGSMQRWSQKDYISKDWDKSNNGMVIVSHSKPKDGEIRNICNTGKWTVNYKDSSITIISGSIYDHPINIHAKYTLLGSGSLTLATTTIFDTTLNGSLIRCRKVLTKYYTHPWIDGFQ